MHCQLQIELNFLQIDADDRYDGEVRPHHDIRTQDAQRMQYYEATLHINSIYAQRHGYKFIHQGSGAYGKLDKHMSWMKLQMIRDQLECCCQFALFLDSDSFIADQKLSIEAWLGESLSLHNPTETDPTAMVSDNAPYIGYCAANLIFTRTQRSAEILQLLV